jgi:hypothetical protein
MRGVIRNERLKFLANWFNAIATAVLTVGAFTPLAVTLYGIGEPPKNSDLLFYLPHVCIVGAIALHLLGHLFLLGLVNSDDE